MAARPAEGAGGRAPQGDGPLSEVALSLERASVELGGRLIWQDVSIAVASGEFVAVLGSNGAGKSTLLKVALGLVPLRSGTASVLGREPGQANAELGYLPQRRSFDSSSRIRGVDIVQLGLDGARWGVPCRAGVSTGGSPR